MTVNSVNFSQY